MEIMWKESLWVNALRLICATVVWFFIALMMGQSEVASAIYALPVFYLVLAPVAILFSKFPNPIGWFISLMALITILPGDPIVFIIRLIWPQAVPMQYYSPLNFAYFLYIHT